MSLVQVRERAIGLFGEITVVDDGPTRSLWCDLHCQGSNFLTADGQPDVVPEATYVLGWLAAVVDNPRARVLMAGLGAGSGPIAMLHAFPELHITVVEIDPIIIDVAVRQFPWISIWQERGRLQLREESIDVALQSDGTYDVIILDAYEDNVTGYLPNKNFTLAGQRAPQVWLNCVDDGGQRSEQVARRAKTCGLQPQVLMLTQHVEDELQTGTGNCLIGCGVTPTPAWAALRPFADRTDVIARVGDDSFQASVAEIRRWNG